MPLDPELESISGARELYDWFGYWPKFHDAEILRFQINQEGESSLAIHAWEMTKEVDDKGYYRLTKHIVVEFVLQNVQKIDLQDFFDHSIIFDLKIKKIESGFKLDIFSSYGLNGSIDVGSVSIRTIPGEPSAEG